MPMNPRLRSLIRTIARLLRLDRFFRRLYHELRADERRLTLAQAVQGRAMGRFEDSRGCSLPLIEGLRDRLKPEWRRMFQPPSEASGAPDNAAAAARLDSRRERVACADRILGVFGFTCRGKSVVEVGASDGAAAYALAEAGAAEVIGTDIAAYYIHQTPGGVVSEGAVRRKNDELEARRGAYAATLDAEVSARVSFVEDDVCTSDLPGASADAILSWEVLEHLTRPLEAFRRMFHVLKPGGVAFHEYNPFLALDGGHSLCVLDIPWGHARLSPEDFRRYIREFRPDEEQVALSFYENNLNRMTLSDLRGHIETAGFRPTAVIPLSVREHLDILTPEIARQCRAVYPTAAIADLISPAVTVVMQKP